MIKFLHIYHLSLAILLVGCTQKALDDMISDDLFAIEFTTSGSITRSEESSIDTEDLRFSLVSKTTNAAAPSRSCIYTYNSAESTFTRGEGSTGLYCSAGNYYLVIATPTSAMSKVGSSTAYGHLVERVTDDPLYIYDKTAVYVDGIAVTTNGTTYIHDLGTVNLSQRRSKLKVFFQSDSDIDLRTVNDLYIKDVYNNGYTCTQSGVLFSDTDITETICDFTTKFPLENIPATTLTLVETDEEDDYTYLISADYSNSSYTYPTLVVGLKDGDVTRDVNIPLNVKMEAMTCYTYEITISSTALTVSVYASAWDTVDTTGLIEKVTEFEININEDDWSSTYDEGLIDNSSEEAIVDEVDLTVENNSNCYILNPSSEGTMVYYIPISRIDEFWTDENYVESNYVRNANRLSTVGDDWEPMILWHDFNSSTTYKPMSDLSIEKYTSPSGNDCVKVSIPSSFAASESHCNIGYVVRKTSDETVLWSWHLWITDYNPYSNTEEIESDKYQYPVEGGELHRYKGTLFTSGIYIDKLIMDRNIGARSASFEGHGSLTSTTVSNPGTLHFQFGRKDPFSPYWGFANSYTYGTLAGQLSFEDSVNYPSKFITNSGNWCNEGDSTDYIWNDYKISKTGYVSGKSIFDPSPLGFRVPINGIWSDFTMTTFAVQSTLYGRVYYDFAYYPFSGYRQYTTGNLTYVGSVGYNRTATPYSTSAAYHSDFYSTGQTMARYYSRAYGFAVRPIQE